MLNEQNTVRR